MGEPRRFAPTPDGRTAIGGLLYTFLSAYGRLAPSGLRRFILRSLRSDAEEIQTDVVPKYSSMYPINRP